MTYAAGPYTRHASLPVPPRPKLAEAREINFTTMTYVVDPVTGGFSHMPPTPQMVVILSFRVKVGKFNTLPERNRYKQGIEEVLNPLVISNPPLITDLEVIVERTAAGTLYKLVKFRDVSDHRRPVVEIQLP